MHLAIPQVPPEKGFNSVPPPILQSTSAAHPRPGPTAETPLMWGELESSGRRNDTQKHTYNGKAQSMWLVFGVRRAGGAEEDFRARGGTLEVLATCRLSDL